MCKNLYPRLQRTELPQRIFFSVLHFWLPYVLCSNIGKCSVLCVGPDMLKGESALPNRFGGFCDHVFISAWQTIWQLYFSLRHFDVATTILAFLDALLRNFRVGELVPRDSDASCASQMWPIFDANFCFSFWWNHTINHVVAWWSNKQCT